MTKRKRQQAQPMPPCPANLVKNYNPLQKSQGNALDNQINDPLFALEEAILTPAKYKYSFYKDDFAKDVSPPTEDVSLPIHIDISENHNSMQGKPLSSPPALEMPARTFAALVKPTFPTCLPEGKPLPSQPTLKYIQPPSSSYTQRLNSQKYMSKNSDSYKPLGR